MQWLTEYNNEIKKASDEQLKLWLQHIKLFDKKKPIEKYASNHNSPLEREKDKNKREKCKSILTAEIKRRKKCT